MNRLYNEYEMLTPDGQDIDHAATAFCRTIFATCVANGQSLRDAELVLINAITGTAAEALLTESMRRRKQEKEKAKEEFVSAMCDFHGGKKS